MIEKQIREWMNHSGSFVAGMKLCAQVNPKVHHRLATWLGKPLVPIEAKQQLVQALRPYAAPAGGEGRGAPGKSPAEEPEAVRRLREEGRLKLKEYDQYKTHLRYMTVSPDVTDADRYVVARHIMEVIIPAADAIYDRIRAYEQRGEVPTIADSELVQQTVEKMQRIQSLRPRISRLKKFLEKDDLDELQRRKYELELLEKEQELDTIESELRLK